MLHRSNQDEQDLVAVGLLRGINVGGNRIIKMATLRDLCERAGFRSVATLLQSGNVVFRLGQDQLPFAAARLEEEIERDAGFRPRVMVRTLPELEQVVLANPFEGRADVEAAKLLVFFLDSAPNDSPVVAGPETMVVNGREAYVYFPQGVGQSKLVPERALKTDCTGRNWNTVLRLLQLAKGT